MPVTHYIIENREDPSHLHRRNGQGYYSSFARCWIHSPLNAPGCPIRLYCTDCGHPLHRDNPDDEEGVCEICGWGPLENLAGRFHYGYDRGSTLAFRTENWDGNDDDFNPDAGFGYTPGEDRRPEPGAPCDCEDYPCCGHGDDDPTSPYAA